VAKQSQQSQQSNVPSEVWAEALAAYILDKAAEDRARGNTKKHQLMFETQGVDPSELRRRYKGSQLSEEDRIQLYANEQRSRRALDLWSASSPKDFERLLRQASETKPATGASADRVDDARAYSDGNNSGRIGGGSVDDNPFDAGTSQHQQWALGWADGIDEDTRAAASREAPAMGEANGDAREAPPKKRAGRTNKAAATSAVEDTITSDEGVVIPASMFEDALPMPPGMPD
jgi:ribosome modulation factor